MSRTSADISVTAPQQVSGGKVYLSLFLLRCVTKLFPQRPSHYFHAAITAAVITTLSCSVFRPPGADIRTWSAPEDILRAYNENYSRIKTLTGRGLLSLQSDEVNEQGTVRVWIKMPDSLKVKLEGPLGIDIVSFFMDRNSYLLYLHRDEIVYSGTLETLNIASLLNDLTGVRLSEMTVDSQEVHEAILGFFAGLTLLEPQEIFAVNFSDSARIATVFARYGTDPEVRYEFPRGREFLRRVEILDTSHTVRIEKTFTRYTRKKGIFMPRRIRSTFYRERGRIALQYLNMNINKKLKPEEFSINIPPDVKSFGTF